MEEAPERKMFKFGNEKSHDVILQVGDADFHVNKEVLSAQSDFFYALFNSDFKEKNDDRVKIEADEDAFECLMEMIFNLRLKTSIACPPGNHICGTNRDCKFNRNAWSSSYVLCTNPKKMYDHGWAYATWKQTMGTIELAERFQMDNVKKMISDRLRESGCNKEICANCALKLFLRCVCKMIEEEEKAKMSRLAASKLFEWYSDVMGDFMINGRYMKKFMEMIDFE